MPTFTIRGISDDVARAIQERATSAGQSTEAYVRQILEQLAQEPTVKTRYLIRAAMNDGTAAHAHLRREPDGLVGRGASNCSEAQYAAYKRAIELVTRNDAGDREQAIGALNAQFDEVFES